MKRKERKKRLSMTLGWMLVLMLFFLTGCLGKQPESARKESDTEAAEKKTIEIGTGEQPESEAGNQGTESEGKTTQTRNSAPETSAKAGADTQAKVAYYENVRSLTSGNTGYESGLPCETMMDVCRKGEKNPTWIVKTTLRKNQIPLESFVPEDTLETMKQNRQNPLLEKTWEKVETVEFSAAGCQRLLQNILMTLKQRSEGTMDDFDMVCSNPPTFFYSEEDSCFYTYVQMRFQGMTYLLNVYMKSDGLSGEPEVTEVSAEFIIGRYVLGGAAGSSIHLQSMREEARSYQLMFAQAATYCLSGESADYSKEDMTEEGWERIVHRDTVPWQETVRFYHASVPDEESDWAETGLESMEYRIYRTRIR